MYVSSSIYHRTYSSRLADRSAIYPKLDPSETWAQFIRDHIYQLREGSAKVIVTPFDMNRYRYRVRDYLSRVLNVNGDIELVFRIINKLTDDIKFNDSVTVVYVPDNGQLNKLRTKYNTVIANYKRKGAV